MRNPIRSRTALLAAAWLIALAAIPAAALAEPMFKGGPALAGVYAAPSPSSYRGIRFAFRAGAPIRSTPARAGGLLYFGSSDGILHALDEASGAERWRFQAGGGITSSPAVAAGKVLFTARDRKLWALDARTGRAAWSLPFAADLGKLNYWDYYMSSPSVAGDVAYVGSGDGHLYAVSVANGRVAWRTDAGARIRSTPAVSGELVVFGTMDGHVVALDRRTGRERWRFATDGVGHPFEEKNNDITSVPASPAIADGTVLIGGRDGMVYALDLATGALRWKHTHDGGSWILATAAQGGRAYTGSGSAFVVELADLATGAQKWRFKTSSAVFGALSIAGDVLLFQDMNGILYAVDKLKGEELWRFSVPGRAFAAPLPGDGLVYVSSDDGILYALETVATPPPARPPLKKYVYFEGRRSSAAFSWFKDNIDDAILAYFKGAGYEQVDAAQLRDAMEAQKAGTLRTLIVFADDKIPAFLINPRDATAPVRRYLDAGGRAAFLGPNPVAFDVEPTTGELRNIDYALVGKVLGIAYPPRKENTGYHVSTPTAEGRFRGLRDDLVANGGIDPAQATTILATDEFGAATAWVKSYPSDGAVIELPVPNTQLVDLNQYRLAIENGL
jgi:outer membrane protein assembly factor BamB